MTENRFDGLMGKDYLTLDDGILHDPLLQQKVGETVRDYFQDQVITVLELGFGTGTTTLPLLKATSQSRIVAVDSAPGVIRIAADRLHEYSRRITLLEEDALDYLLDAESNSFDAFVSGYTLHNFLHSYRSKVLKAIYRVLKPRGLFANGDKYAYDDPAEHQIHMLANRRKFERFREMGRPDLTEKWIKHDIEDQKPERIMKLGASVEEMTRIGYRGMKCTYRHMHDALLLASKPSH